MEGENENLHSDKAKYRSGKHRIGINKSNKSFATPSQRNCLDINYNKD